MPIEHSAAYDPSIRLAALYKNSSGIEISANQISYTGHGNNQGNDVANAAGVVKTNNSLIGFRHRDRAFSDDNNPILSSIDSKLHALMQDANKASNNITSIGLESDPSRTCTAYIKLIALATIRKTLRNMDTGSDYSSNICTTEEILSNIIASHTNLKGHKV